MQEFRDSQHEKAGNLPEGDVSCWNEEMHSLKDNLQTTSPKRRAPNDLQRELGNAMTDALADILASEKRSTKPS